MIIRNEVFEKIIDILSEHKYCILRNYEDLPAISNDIDILIDKSEINNVIEKFNKELIKKNVLLIYATEFSCYSIYFYDREQNIIFHIDLFPSISWGALEYLDTNLILNTRIKYKSFFIPSPELECIELLLTRLIYLKRVKDKYKPRIMTLYSQNKNAVKSKFTNLYGNDFTDKILNYLEKEEWEKINNNVTKLRLLTLYNNIKNKKILFNSIYYIKRIIARFINLPGLFLTILGTDGSGKSTVIKEILIFFENIFKEEKVRLFHWRPYFKYKKPSSIENNNPHKAPPFNQFLSLLKLILYFFSYNTGYLTQVLPVLFINGLIIFDRYYYDILVDPLRYRYGGSHWIANYISKIIPTPDIILFLDIEPEKLMERKQELPFEEIKRQRKYYMDLSGNLSNAFIIDSSQSVKNLKNITGNILLDFLHYRYVKRKNIEGKKKNNNKNIKWLISILNLKETFKSSDSKMQKKYVSLSLQDGRLYLFSASSIKTLVNSLDIYNTQSFKAKLGKNLLKFSFKLNIGNYFLPEIYLKNNEKDVENLLEYIEKVMEYEEVNFAISAGTPGPHRKPVIQVLSREGNIICYIKIGWNETTNNLVKNEELIINKLYNSSVSLITPRVLHSGSFKNNYICIQSSPEGKIKSAPHNLNSEYIEVIKKLSLFRKYLTIEESIFWKKINKRLEEIHNYYYIYILKSGLKKVKEIFGNEKIPFHFCHGDFTPWNMKIVNNKLYIFDWEYAGEEGIPGYDLFHFLFQTFWLLKKYSPDKLYKTFSKGHINYEEIVKHINILNINLRFIKPLFLLYLLDRFSFYAAESPEDYLKLRYLSMIINLISLREEEYNE